MVNDYKIRAIETFSEFKKESNVFFPELSDLFLWQFWNEIEKFANEEDNVFDKYHRRADETLITTLADNTIFSEHVWLWFLYSNDFSDEAFACKLKQIVYAVLPIKEAYIIIYMPTDDKFSDRELSYIDSCISEISRSIRLLCIVKETTGDLRLAIHVTRVQ